MNIVYGVNPAYMYTDAERHMYVYNVIIHFDMGSVI